MKGIYRFISSIFVVLIGGVCLHYTLNYLRGEQAQAEKILPPTVAVYKSMEHSWVTSKLEINKNYLFVLEMNVEGSRVEGLENQDFQFNGNWEIINDNYVFRFVEEKPDLTTLDADNSSVEVIDSVSFLFPTENESIVLWGSTLRKIE